MLTPEIKRKIDYLRDALVGKIPVPSDQIAQITLGLIYKFMSDIDEQNEELGGKSFFAGGYKKYSWKNIIDRSLAGHERVLFYSEGLEKMSHNESIPQLFRDIFKGAFLPFKDPAVLDLFLKGINEFKYEHSEDLGDAFEYLLSTAASQGDAGQFRTPRHIIDFIVEAVDPQKEDRILDPACGTAGFLVAAYKHILKNNTDKRSGKLGSLLTTTERKKLTKNIVGYDISHEMVRLSLVNLYLHGFAGPNIYEYDTLASLDRWDDNFDCLLANPPFMTPRGGIKPHNRFPIQAKRSEVLFVDYITEHLTPNGKAGIIVPEGIIFQSGNAYKQLRKMLVEDGLWAVVSLPQGVFNPYSGVKTSILFFSNPIARQTKEILFVKVKNDGFNLGAQRRPIDENDLPKVLEIIKKYKKAAQENKKFDLSKGEEKFASVVKKEKISENGDYNLSADRYLTATDYSNAKWPMTELGEVCEVIKGSPITQKQTANGNIPVIAGGQQPAYFHNISNRSGNIITVSASGAYAGYVNFFTIPIFASDCSTIKSKNEDLLSTRFVYFLLKSKQEVIYKFQQGGGQPHVYPKDLAKIKIPLPSIEVQKEIVAELESYQKIVDGAKQVVENYRPTIKVNPGWKMVKLGDVAEVIAGQSPEGKFYNKAGRGLPFYQGKTEFREMYIGKPKTWTTQITKIANKDEIIMSVRAPVGPVNITKEKICIGRGLAAIRAKKIEHLFLFNYLKTIESKIKGNGGAVFDSISKKQIEDLMIPLPSIDVQRKVIQQLTNEQKNIDSAREMIILFEQKIKDKISDLWGK